MTIYYKNSLRYGVLLFFFCGIDILSNYLTIQTAWSNEEVKEDRPEYFGKRGLWRLLFEQGE